MERYDDNLASRINGNALQPLQGVSITVTSDATGLPASLYSDNGVTPLAQPLITDTNGGYGFYAPDGAYTLTYTGTRIATFTRKIILEDPADNPSASLAQLAAPTGATLMGFQQAGAGAVARTLVSKLGESVSVGDFGAVAGSDSYAAIQAALDHLNSVGGGTLKALPVGVYPVSAQLRLYENVTLDLCGSTIRRDFSTSPTGAGLMGVNGTPENIVIRNGILDGNGDTYPGTGFNIFGGVGFRNLLVDAVTFLDVVDAHALDLAAFDGVVVRHCRFLGFLNAAGNRGYSEAIQADPDSASGGKSNKNLTVEGCYFGPNPDSGFGGWGAGVGNHASLAGLSDSGFVIVGNTFDGCLFAGVRAFKWSNVIIAGNHFKDSQGRDIHVTPLSTGATPEYGENYTITGNTFEGSEGVGILFAAPSSYDTTYAKHKNITITGNTFKSAAANYATIDLRWCSGATVSGNKSVGSISFVNARFVDNVAVTGNQADTLDNNFVWINESTEVSFAGMGLTSDILVSSNEAKDIGYRAVHVNCAAHRVSVTGNQFTNVSTAAATRPGIAYDSGVIDGMISGNAIFDGGAAIKPTYGVLVSSSCSGITVGPNKAFGTLGSYSVAGATNKVAADATSVLGNVKVPLVLAMSSAAASVTGTTAKTTLDTATVPGGAMGANGALRISAVWSYTNSANTKTPRIELGSTAFFGPNRTASAAEQSLTMIRNRGSENAQSAFTPTANSSIGATTGSNITAAIDTSTDQTITFSGQLANAGETLTLESWMVELIPS